MSVCVCVRGVCVCVRGVCVCLLEKLIDVCVSCKYLNSEPYNADVYISIH